MMAGIFGFIGLHIDGIQDLTDAYDVNPGSLSCSYHAGEVMMLLPVL